MPEGVRTEARDKSDLVCGFGKRTGHTETSCFEKNGFPDWWDDRPSGGRETNRGTRGGNNPGRGRGAEVFFLHHQLQVKIVSGVVTKVVSTIFKRLWSVKPTSKTAISSRSMMKFESGYTVETVFDGSKHGIEPYSVEISTNEEILFLDSVNGHNHKISSPLTRFVTRDDKVRVSCEKVAEEGGFGGYLRRGIAVAFSRGGSGGCAWPDAADLEEATGLRCGSGRLRFEAVSPALN
ncbi:hypothetical protein CASFOL_004462 [Castilleja foliolosa]|uniref:Uncharacterized protein n=1 Tax=Castilleja foliolosa TaxID=1961234 RepID=A0ABD3EEA9_9LAMI